MSGLLIAPDSSNMPLHNSIRNKVLIRMVLAWHSCMQLVQFCPLVYAANLVQSTTKFMDAVVGIFVRSQWPDMLVSCSSSYVYSFVLILGVTSCKCAGIHKQMGGNHKTNS